MKKTSLTITFFPTTTFSAEGKSSVQKRSILSGSKSTDSRTVGRAKKFSRGVRQFFSGKNLQLEFHSAITGTGLLLQDLHLPDSHDGAVKGAPHVKGQFIRDVTKLNPKNIQSSRLEKTCLKRWSAMFEITNPGSSAGTTPEYGDADLDNRETEILSEHQCKSWLEAYLLTGLPPSFSDYEVSLHIVDSKFNPRFAARDEQ